MNTSQKASWILVNGLFRTDNEPVVLANSRGLMYGDGCFETMIHSGFGIAGLSDHLDRLRRGLRYLGIREPEILSKDKFISELRLLIQKNRLGAVKKRIRLQVWREQGLGYKTTGDEKVSWTMQLIPVNDTKSSYRLGLSSIRRIPSNAIDPSFKMNNGINYILAANEAKNRKWDDAIMLDQQGNVSETTIANLFWEKDGTWYTPSVDCDILPGITRKFVIEWLKSSKVKVEEGAFTPDDVKKSDALFICNSVRNLYPVSQFENKMFLSGSNHAKSFATWMKNQEEEI